MFTLVTALATAMPAAAELTEEFALVEAPSIVGTPRVGADLVADLGAVTPTAQSHTVEWLIDGDVVGTGDTYVPEPADLGEAIAARVTWSSTEFGDFVADSEPTAPVALGTQAPFVPVVSGIPGIGKTLSIAGLPTADSRSYRWYRNGSPISGAIGSTYKVPTAYLGSAITVKVTSRLAGYASTSALSASVRIGKPFSATRAPIVSGAAKVGRAVKASTQAWSPTATLSYQWMRNGIAISGAKSSTYYPVAADAGERLSVRVTGKRSGYATTIRNSPSQVVALGTIEHDSPEIIGVIRANRHVAVDAGIVTPSSVEVAYQWSLQGVELAGETEALFITTNNDFGKWLSVVVTYSAPGYATTTAEIGARVLRDRASVMQRPGFYSPSGAPGAQYVAAGSYYAAAPSDYCTWWLDSNRDPADGVIAQGTVGTVVIPADAAYFYGEGCGGWRPSSPGISDVPWSEPEPTVAPQGSRAGLIGLSVQLSGSVNYNGTLKATVKAPSPAADYYTYTWKVGGQTFDGAPTFDVSPSWERLRVTVTVTAHRAGFRDVTATATSAPVSNSLADRPSIVGSAVVGTRLTATHVLTGNVKYQWLRDGKPIPGATAKTRTLTSSDAGRAISFRVTKKSTVTGTTIKTSAATAKVLRPITAAPAPVISGAATVGARLSATTGAWTGSPARTYQWFRNGVAISGAKSSTHTVVAGDIGTALTLTVTGTRSGYVTKSVSSKTVQVRAEGVIWAAPPVITGTVRAGETVRAVASASYPSSAATSVQWYRNGDPIDGAIGTTFALKNRDIGDLISVAVTYVADGLPVYEARSADSAPVSARLPIITTYGSHVVIAGYDSPPKAIPAGTYSAPGGPGCGWQLPAASGGGMGHQVVVIPSGTYSFDSFNCGSWRLDDGTFPAEGEGFSDGIYKVGTHIRSGLYQRQDNGSACTVRFSSSWKDPNSALVLEFGVDPSAVIPILSSDQYLVTEGCGDWHRVGDLIG